MTQEQYNQLMERSTPHEVFSTAWGSYSASELAGVFLPKVQMHKAAFLKVFDGALLFNQMQFSDNTGFFNFLGKSPRLSIYTYPKDASISLNKTSSSLKSNETLIFFEVAPDDSVDIYTYFGDEIVSQVNRIGISSDRNSQSKTSTILEIRRFLEGEVSHEKLLLLIGSQNLAKKPETPSQSVINKIRSNPGVEFEAGEIRTDKNNAWAHGDIEFRALEAAGYTQWTIERIYYGNWLRDYSSVITPIAIGFSNEDIQTMSNSKTFQSEYVQDMIPFMPLKPSQKAWVKIVKVLAVKEFRYDRHKTSSENYYDYKDAFNQQFEHLTRDMLGLYLPQEHIDNPKGLVDERVFASSELKAPLIAKYEDESGVKRVKKPYRGCSDVLLLYGIVLNVPGGDNYLKKYIATDIPGYQSSFAFMEQELRLAVKYGWNAEGMRHLGAAFHVIEDYFAHTNFVELILIKIGYLDVHPWVEVDKIYDDYESIEDGKYRILDIPVVTGTFGFEDTIASLGPKLQNEILPLEFSKDIDYKPGDTTFTDMIIVTVLEDFIERELNVTPSQQTIIPGTGKTALQLLVAYRGYKILREAWRTAKLTAVGAGAIKALELLADQVSEAFAAFRNMLIRIFTENYLQSHLHDAIDKKGYGTDPSHTQLAKDRADHPLNPLAGLLAYASIKELGVEIKKILNSNGKKPLEPLIQRIKDELFTHPSDNDFYDQKVKDWAEKNTSAVAEAEYKSITERIADFIEALAPEFYENNEEIFQKLIDKANEENEKK